jgi:periplasmic protein TonB
MTQAESASWGVAIVLSLFLHGMMFVQGGAQPGKESAPLLETPHVTRLSFSQFTEQPVLDEPRPIEKPPLKPVVEKPKPKPKIKPRPARVVKKIPQPEPVEDIKPVRQVAALPQDHGQQVTRPSDGLLLARRQKYLHELLSHIESFKFYPRAARRRSIEGDVSISFILRNDGSYEQLVLDGRDTVLVKAARQALESAAPLPTPPTDIMLSDRIEFTIAYSLDH